MAANWQPVQIPTGGGIDTKTDEKRLPLERVADLQNIVFTDAPGWKLRNGYTALDNRQLGASTRITNGQQLGVRNNELVQFDDEFLWSYSTKSERWKQVGRIAAPSSTLDPLLDQPDNQTEVDTYTVNGIRLTSWISSDDSLVHYQVTDEDTGTILVADTAITGASRARCCGNAGSLHLLHYKAAANSLTSLTVNTENPTSTTTTELVTDVHTDALFDIAPDMFTGSNCFVVYKESGTNEVAGFILRDAGNAPAGASDLGTATGMDGIIPGVLTVNSASDGAQAIFTVVAIEASGTDATVNQFNSSLSPLDSPGSGTVPANVTNAQGISDTVGSVNIWWDVSDTDDWNYYVQYNVDESLSTAFNSASTFRHSSLASKPFMFDERGYILTAHASTLQSKYFLLDGRGNLSARLLDGIGLGHVAADIPSVQQTGTGVYKLALGFRKRLTIDDNDGTPDATKVFSESGSRIVTLDFTDLARYNSVQAGQTLYVNAGFLWQYDGVVLRESGFHLFPENIEGSSNDTGTSNLINAETYNYRVYYEYTNNAGERQRSTAIAFSHTLSATGDGTGTITLDVPTLQHSAVASEVSIVVYRTEGDASVTAGAPFYRVSDVNPANNTGNNRYVENDTSSNTVAFIDNIGDSDLINRELDYQNTGELDNTAPLAGNVMGYGKSRVWIGANSAALFSKLRLPGNLVEFHDGNLITLPDEGGDVTAISELNHHVVFFKRDRIYVVSGEGPDNLGRGFFNLPQLVTVDVGCNNPNSVVRYDGGVLFQSDKGIYNLGHNLNVAYIGAPVEDFNDLVITDSTVSNDTNEVRFLTNGNRTLVFNYLFKLWSTFTNHAGLGSALWNQTYVYLRSDTGRVFQESQTSFTDNGAGYGWLVKSAHLGIAGPVGHQLVRHLHVLGEFYSAHELQVRCNYNNEGFTETATYDPTGTNGVSTYGAGAYGSGAYGGTGSPNYEARFNLPRHKCRTVQFEISCIPTVSGRSCEIDAMAVFAAAKYGNNKTADGRNFGE